MKILIIVILCLLNTTSYSQQASSTPLEQALGSKLMSEIQNGLSCSSQLITVQSDLAKALAKIKELEDKK